MRKFKVISGAVGGRRNKVFKSQDIVTENDFEPGTITGLINGKYIQEIPEDPEALEKAAKAQAKADKAARKLAESQEKERQEQAQKDAEEKAYREKFDSRKAKIFPYWSFLKGDQISIDWGVISQEDFDIIYNEVVEAKEVADAIVTDESGADVVTDESDADVVTDESDADVVTDESDADVETDESNSDVETDVDADDRKNTIKSEMVGKTFEDFKKDQLIAWCTELELEHKPMANRRELFAILSDSFNG
jgi:hypothetical protein